MAKMFNTCSSFACCFYVHNTPGAPSFSVTYLLEEANTVYNFLSLEDR